MTLSTQTTHCLPHRPAIFLSLLRHPLLAIICSNAIACRQRFFSSQHRKI
jgi:hypothetical protein